MSDNVASETLMNVYKINENIKAAYSRSIVGVYTLEMILNTYVVIRICFVVCASAFCENMRNEYHLIQGKRI